METIRGPGGRGDDDFKIKGEKMFTIFMPGARPGDRGNTSIGAMHYPAWLVTELSKGREFEVVKVSIQTEHRCLLDGVAVEFRAGQTYDIPKELAEHLVAEREGELAIAVLIEEPGTKPRRIKDESKIIVKVKMLSTQKSSFDGIVVQEFKAGEIYALPKPKAEGFVCAGWAELLDEETPAKESKEKEEPR